MKNFCQNILKSETSGSTETQAYLNSLGGRRRYPVLLTGTVKMGDGSHSVIPKVHGSIRDAISSVLVGNESGLSIDIENYMLKVRYSFSGGDAELCLRKLSSKGITATSDGVRCEPRGYWFTSIPGSDVLA